MTFSDFSIKNLITTTCERAIFIESIITDPKAIILWMEAGEILNVVGPEPVFRQSYDVSAIFKNVEEVWNGVPVFRQSYDVSAIFKNVEEVWNGVGDASTILCEYGGVRMRVNCWVIGAGWRDSTFAGIKVIDFVVEEF